MYWFRVANLAPPPLGELREIHASAAAASRATVSVFTSAVQVPKSTQNHKSDS